MITFLTLLSWIGVFIGSAIGPFYCIQFVDEWRRKKNFSKTYLIIGIMLFMVFILGLIGVFKLE